MANESLITDLLRCAVQVVGRLVLPEEKIRAVVGTQKRQVDAYNLCGVVPLSETNS